MSSSLLSAISELGFEKPSPIQAQALPILLGKPTDFIGLAATGTGKTAAFAIPLLEKIDPSRKVVQALVLCPTRELAIQVAGQIDLLGRFKGIHALPVYGGTGYGDQLSGLKKGAMVVVGTPGRVVDHLERGRLELDDLEVIVLDEADEMISMGFKDDLEMILGNVTSGIHQTWLFSATMSPAVRQVADQYLRDPKRVEVNRSEILPDSIEQLYYCTHEGNKPEVLCKIIDAADEFYGIVFCQTKVAVADLTQFLKNRGYRVDCLHGDMEQEARERTMGSFRDRKVNLLICTDVASRGLDVKEITHVVNYSIPREMDVYIHRIGRTGRSGNQGVAISLVTPSHRGLVRRIEQITKKKMKEGKIPTRKEIGEKKIAKSLARFQDQATFQRAVELLNADWRAALENLSSEEIVGRFLCMMFPEVFVEREKMNELRELTRVSEGGSSDSGNPRGRRGEFRDSRRESRGHGRDSRDSRRDSRDSRKDFKDSRGFGSGGFKDKKRFDDRAPAPWKRNKRDRSFSGRSFDQP